MVKAGVKYIKYNAIGLLLIVIGIKNYVSLIKNTDPQNCSIK